MLCPFWRKGCQGNTAARNLLIVSSPVEVLPWCPKLSQMPKAIDISVCHIWERLHSERDFWRWKKAKCNSSANNNNNNNNTRLLHVTQAISSGFVQSVSDYAAWMWGTWFRGKEMARLSIGPFLEEVHTELCTITTTSVGTHDHL